MSDLKKVISIELDDNTKAGMANINKTIDAAGKSIENANKQAVNLKLELRQLQKDLLSGKFTGEEFDQATQRAGELKDTISDLNSRIRTLGSDTRTLDGLINAAEGVAGGFALAQGTAALLGDENEQLNQALLKVQASMAILQGLQSVANVLQKESAARILATTAAQKLYTFATEGATVATKALRVALLATGIGAIVVAVIALIAAWKEYSDATEEAKKSQDELNKSLEYNKTLTEDELKNIDYKTKIALLSAKARGASEYELTKIILDGIKARIAALDLEEKKMKATPFNKWTDDMKKRSIEITREQLQLLQQQDLILTEFASNMIIGIKENAKKIEIQRQYNFKKEKENTIKNANELRDLVERLRQDQLAKELELQEKAKKIQEDVRKSLEPEETPAQKLRREYEENLKVLEAAHQSTLALTAKYNTDKFLLDYDYREKLRDSQKQADEYDLKAKQAFEDAKYNIAFQSIGLLSELFGKNRDIANGLLILEKSLAIGQVITTASRGIAQATANLAATPAAIGPFPNPMYAVQAAATAKGIATTKISAGISIATILAQTIGKLSSNPSSLGGGSGGGASTPAPQAQFNIVGQSSANRLAETIANRQQQPVKAYVVGQDVTTQQSLDRNKINNSTFL